MTGRALADTLRETLAVFETDVGTPLTTAEVTDALDVGHPDAADRLEQLADYGYLEAKSVGARDRIWWRPQDDGDDESATPRDRAPAAATDPALADGRGRQSGVFVLDSDGRIQTWNDGTRWPANRDDVRSGHFSRVDRKFHAGLRVHTDATGDADADRTGVPAATRDATDRRAAERRLERTLDDVFERIDDAFYALDEEWRFTYVNDRAEELLERPADDLVGEHIWTVLPRPVDNRLRREYERAMETQEPANFEYHTDRLDGWFEIHVYPSRSGLSVYFRDVTERKERERELEWYETVLETVDDGIHVTDADGRFVMVNEAYASMLGYDREELVGERALDVVSDAASQEGRELEHRLRTGDGEQGSLEVELERANGETVPAEIRVQVLSAPEDEFQGVVGVVRDVSDRKRRGRELERSERRYRALAEHFPNGVVALFDADLEYTLVAGQLFDEYDVASDDLVGAHVGDHFLAPDSCEGFRTCCRDALDGEFSEFAFEYEDSDFDAWTVPVTDEDGDVFAGMIMFQDVTAQREHEEQLVRQREHEEQLVRQRERLVALNNLNRVVRDITEGVLEQSTREEIERTVCEAIADVDSYAFAWIAEVDSATQRIEERVEAGVDGYIENVALSTDSGKDTGRGPAGRAIRTKNAVAIQNVFEDPSFEPWRDVAREYGYRASMAIPIVYEGTLYGVLGVYADRNGAFVGEEQRMLSQLGEVVGHAIASVERKRALMSDEVIELSFHIPDVFDIFGIEASADARVTIDQAVPAGDGDYLVYGTANADGVDVVDALVDARHHWEEFSILDEGGDAGRARYQARLSDPPLLSAVAAQGGSVEDTVIAEGDYRMTLHFAPSVDVRRVTDLVKDAYPTAEMVSRRQRSRADDDVTRPHRVFGEDLTDRQRAALEAAYFGGYFEWPRENSGEDLSNSLGVSSPTFHQHLRKAQRKVFGSILAGAVD